jgi:hypothetical protein
VVFPTPTIFYPLQPTRIYETQVRTVVYVRGLVRATADLAVQGVECKYLRGVVKDVNLGYSFASHARLGGGYLGSPPPGSTLELLTRVEVTSPPPLWNHDLSLEPGAPTAIELARFIDANGPPLLWGTSIVLAMILAVALPWGVVPLPHRHWTDWLYALAVGAGTGLSIWVAALVFVGWIKLRVDDRAPGRDTEVMGRVLAWVALSGVGLTIVGACGGLLFPLLLLGGTLLGLSFPGLVIYWLARVGGWVRALWFSLFIVVHGSFACLLIFGILHWLSAYE